MGRKHKQGSGRTTNRPVTKPALMKAAVIVGGVTNLALDVGVTHSAISNWLYTKEKIPAHHVHKIVKATKGQVKPQELRPDVFIDN